VSTELWVSASIQDHCRVLAAGGDVDLQSAPRFREALSGALLPGTPLVLDLSEILFMDSAGLKELARAHRDATAMHSRLLVIPSSAVTRVLELSGVATTLTLCRARADALQSAQAWPSTEPLAALDDTGELSQPEPLP
jgi:anti-sigma B factor antagonist